MKMKKVIIIGATSGIGRGLAETYINEGRIVGIVGRRELILQEICSQSEDYHYRVCDITNDNDTLYQLNILTNEMGGMDILVICSGVGEVNPELDYRLEKPTLLTNVIRFTKIGLSYSFNTSSQDNLLLYLPLAVFAEVVLPRHIMQPKHFK